MVGEVLYGGVRVIKSFGGKGKNWERFFME